MKTYLYFMSDIWPGISEAVDTERHTNDLSVAGEERTLCIDVNTTSHYISISILRSKTLPLPPSRIDISVIRVITFRTRPLAMQIVLRAFRAKPEALASTHQTDVNQQRRDEVIHGRYNPLMCCDTNTRQLVKLYISSDGH